MKTKAQIEKEIEFCQNQISYYRNELNKLTDSFVHGDIPLSAFNVSYESFALIVHSLSSRIIALNFVFE